MENRNREVVLCEIDYKGYYKRFALTRDEFVSRFGEDADLPRKLHDSDAVTLMPLVHLWFQSAEIGDEVWFAFFHDMCDGLPDSDVEVGNLAYIDIVRCES